MAAFGAIILFCLAPFTNADSGMDEEIDAAARALEDRVIAWRRDLHEHPELSNREFRTSKLLARHLRKIGYKVKTGIAHTGVVGVLKGGKPGPVVALRADMDGLPVIERTGLSYASTAKSTYEGNEVGVMHACGHDNHMAILMGAAQVLAGMREELAGTVKIIFQPAEEGAPQGEEGGAAMMVAEGVLQNPAVDAIFGLHISQGDTVGNVSYRAGSSMASAQRFDITITGRQTHGVQPWSGIDPIVVGAQVVGALQTIVSRQVNITRAPAVVSVGSFHAGVRNNIIPKEAKLSGTIRTFDPAVREFIHQRVVATVESIAQLYGATASVDIDPGVPVTFNDRALTAQMLPTLQRVYGAAHVSESALLTGAEDFSFYQEQIPGLFFFIGARPPGIPRSEAIPNHSPLFFVDEGALTPGVKVMAGLAVDYLEQYAQP